MKVVLKVTVFDRILKDLDSAKRDNRAVDYIVITDKEYDELRADGRVRDALGYAYSIGFSSSAQMDTTLVTKEFPLVDTSRASYARHRPFIRAYTRETLFGVNLYVVPEEYCPR